MFIPSTSHSNANYLGQNGDSKGLIVVFAHQVQGDDWKNVPGRSAGLPTHQLFPQPESRGKLFSLQKKKRLRSTFGLLFPAFPALNDPINLDCRGSVLTAP